MANHMSGTGEEWPAVRLELLNGGEGVDAAQRRVDAGREEKPMCPVCLATALLIAGKVAATGGVAAIAIKKLGGKNAVDNYSAPEALATETREPFRQALCLEAQNQCKGEVEMRRDICAQHASQAQQ